MKHPAPSPRPLRSFGTACGDDPSSARSVGDCIATGTLVHTPDGTCPIESLEAGCVVLGVDPAAGELRPARVVAVRSAERECLQLRLPGRQALVCTNDHPLYDPDTGQHAPASEWVDGRRTHVAMLVDGRLRRTAVEGHSHYVGVRRVLRVTLDAGPHGFIASGCLVHDHGVPSSATDPRGRDGRRGRG